MLDQWGDPQWNQDIPKAHCKAGAKAQPGVRTPVLSHHPTPSSHTKLAPSPNNHFTEVAAEAQKKSYNLARTTQLVSCQGQSPMLWQTKGAAVSDGRKGPSEAEA